MAGAAKKTKTGIPWILIYKETFTAKQEAYKREMQLKKYKGGNAFKKNINK